MRKLTNKLFISILTVAFAVIALGTTTFAWFTLSNTATVAQFNASVTSGEGMEISLDGVNWKTTLSNSDITEFLFADEKPYAGFRFDAVSTALGSTWNLNDAAKTDVTIGYTSGTYQVPDTTLINGVSTAKYITFKLYFRSSQTVQPKVLWESVTLTQALPISWVPDATFIDANGTPITAGGTGINKYGANAARIQVKGTNTYTYELPNTIYGNTVLDANSAVDFTEDGVEEPTTPVDKGVDGSVNYYYEKTGSLPFNANSVTTVDTIQEVNKATTTTSPVAALVAGTGAETGYWVGSVTVTIWIEGWDADAYNAILKSVLTLGLSFTKENVA